MAEYYPPVGFHFLVKFEKFSEETDSRFQEVSGLSVTVSTDEVSEGGENRFSHKLPKKMSYDSIVLKRGLIKNSKITAWCKEAVENLNFEPQNLLISLLNEEHTELCSWNVVHAYPVKWSFAGLNAQNNELLIETIELNYHYFTVKNL
ncbi:MAG TPA: phage tail protein [Chryseolinea sp.]|nr:phage tail protein [Chryseolinea sp.]